MRALRKYEVEVSRLRSLYGATVFSLSSASQQLERELTTHGARMNPVTFEVSGLGTQTLAGNFFHFKNRAKGQFLRYLRETIFVRLISALEVFLIDALKYCLNRRQDLLAGRFDRPIELHFIQLRKAAAVSELINQIVQNECRQLHSQGFREIAKYYKKVLKVNFWAVAGSKVFEELHDRRHLLVHRLGKADEKYRNAYRLVGQHVKVGPEYLAEAFRLRLRSGAGIAALTRHQSFGR